jgi:glyoxylase I family protein
MAFELAGVCPLLQVFDMPASIRFYCDSLGFELVQHSPIVHGRDGEYLHWAMLRRGGATLMLNTAYDEGERPPAPDPARVAAHTDTIVFFGCADVDEAFRELRSRGISFQEEINTTGYGMRRFTFFDPDGYLLCFQGPLPQR